MANRIRFTAASQVAEAFPASAESVGLPMDETGPVDFLRAIAESEEPMPGVSFAAFALPKREGIWWGCLCLRQLDVLDADGQAALAITDAWVRKPDEEERRAAGEIAARQEFANAGAMIAQAAFCSGGSLAPAEFGAVPPAPDLTAKCLNGALLVALGQTVPVEIADNARKCIASAIDFAEGGDGMKPWGAAQS